MFNVVMSCNANIWLVWLTGLTGLQGWQGRQGWQSWQGWGDWQGWLTIAYIWQIWNYDPTGWPTGPLAQLQGDAIASKNALLVFDGFPSSSSSSKGCWAWLNPDTLKLKLMLNTLWPLSLALGRHRSMVMRKTFLMTVLMRKRTKRRRFLAVQIFVWHFGMAAKVPY